MTDCRPSWLCPTLHAYADKAGGSQASRVATAWTLRQGHETALRRLLAALAELSQILQRQIDAALTGVADDLAPIPRVDRIAPEHLLHRAQGQPVGSRERRLTAPRQDHVAK